MKQLYTFIILTLAFPPSAWAEQSVSRAQQLMGTLCEVQFWGDKKNQLSSSIDLVFEEIAHLESLVSLYDKESELSKLNLLEPMNERKVSDTIFNLISYAQNLSKETKGAFNMLNGSLNSSDVLLNKNKRTIEFQKTGVTVDLNGIAKGFALDRAIEILKSRDVKKARINFGGQISQYGGTLPSIQINNPNGKYVEFHLAEGSVSTSSQLENENHITDKRNGTPAPYNGTVSVISKSGVEADGMSTALFVLGPDQGISFANEQPDFCALYIFWNPKKDRQEIKKSDGCEKFRFTS